MFNERKNNIFFHELITASLSKVDQRKVLYYRYSTYNAHTQASALHGPSAD